jgi:hypothetical protein
MLAGAAAEVAIPTMPTVVNAVARSTADIRGAR